MIEVYTHDANHKMDDSKSRPDPASCGSTVTINCDNGIGSELRGSQMRFTQGRAEFTVGSMLNPALQFSVLVRQQLQAEA
jgi:hypothetical protein